MAVGLIVGPSLILSPRVIGGIVFDIHTLLYAALAIVIGFQAIIFATFTKVFAITEGLLPSDPRLDRVMKYVTLETGLLVGFFLFLLGLGGSIYAVLFWDEHSFGQLDPARTLRFVIPAVTALMLGCQIILSSFFLSILGLRRR